MNSALFTSAAGMMDNAQKMETIVHNLANVSTTAYKRHIALSVPFTRFLDEEVDDIKGTATQMFAGQHVRYCFSDGAMKFTERNLDVALQDLNQPTKNESCCFFNVKVNPRTVSRPRQYRFDREGYLVEATGADGKGIGKRAQDVQGKPIRLPEGATPGDFSIDEEGFIYIQGAIIGEVDDHIVETVIDPGIQYTRNGNFHLKVEDGSSYLVNVDGFRIQGQNGDIKFDGDVTARQIAIDLQGRIYAKGKQVDQLKISVLKDVPFNGQLRFTVDNEGFVVNARGRRITDVNGQFIAAPKGASLDVSPDGKIKANGEVIGLTLERPGKIERGEDEPPVTQTRFGYYVPTDEFVAVEDATDCQTHQCYLEQSNVNVVAELGQMIITMRTFEADAKMLQTMEENLRQVANSQPT